MLSPPPAETGIPAGIPYAFAASAETTPAGAEGSIKSGRISYNLLSIMSQIFLDQQRFAESNNAVPEASPYSITYLPVSFQFK